MYYNPESSRNTKAAYTTVALRVKSDEQTDRKGHK